MFRDLFRVGLLFLVLARPCFGDFAYIVNEESPGTVSVLNTSSNTIIATVTVGNNPNADAITPNGMFVYVTNSTDNSVSVFNAASLQVIATIALSGSPTAIAMAPNGNTVYVGDSSGQLYAISTSSNTIISTPLAPPASSVSSLAVSPDNAGLYVGYPGLSKFESFALNPDGTFSAGGVSFPDNRPQVMTSATTPGGGQFVFSGAIAGGAGGALEVIDVKAPPNPTFNQIIATVTVGSVPNGIAVSPNGEFIYISNDFASKYINVINTSNFNTFVATITNPPTGIDGPTAFTANGLTAYVLNFSTTGLVNVIDTNQSSPTYNTVIATVTVDPNFNDIAMGTVAPSSISAPSNLTGKQKKHDFGVVYELFNLLEWGPVSTGTAAGFNIYRDGILIATVGPTTFKYKDHDRKKGVANTYQVTAVTSSGTESSPATITIP